MAATSRPPAPNCGFQNVLRFPTVRVTAFPSTSVETTCHLRVESVERFSGAVNKLREELDSLTAGDRVKMEMSPYDLNKARITWRLR